MTRWWAVVLLVLGAVPVGAQTVYNPTRVVFDSPDHASPCPDPDPPPETGACVLNYKLEFWLAGVDPVTGQPVSVYDVPKEKVTASGLPLPQSQYQFRLADTSPVAAIPVGQTYVARMVALGAAGGVSPRSDPSNPFALAPVPRSPANLSAK